MCLYETQYSKMKSCWMKCFIIFPSHKNAPIKKIISNWQNVRFINLLFHAFKCTNTRIRASVIPIISCGLYPRTLLAGVATPPAPSNAWPLAPWTQMPTWTPGPGHSKFPINRRPWMGFLFQLIEMWNKCEHFVYCIEVAIVIVLRIRYFIWLAKINAWLVMLCLCHINKI